MIRDSKGTENYWAKWIDFENNTMARRLKQIEQPSGNPRYRPQFVYEMSNSCYEQILRKYSHGDSVASFNENFELLISLWEKAEELGKDVWTPEAQFMRHSWEKNLDHYICCFWLVGLAYALEIPDPLLDRLLTLIGNEGKDELLDRAIAVRQSGRAIGKKLCHPKPYQRLLAAVYANTQAEGARALKDFVDHWYAELDRPPQKGRIEATAMYERPYWYEYGNENFEGGAYFGRWCVEAVAAVKAFGLDDSLCLGHPAYPGDLLRPNGPTTHPLCDPGLVSSTTTDVTQQQGWLSRFFTRR